jgi:hypothetical protein
VIQFVVGLPDPLTDWCATATAEVLRRAGRSVTVGRAATLADVAGLAVAATTDDVLCVCNSVDAALATAIVAQPRPYVVAACDPAAAFHRAAPASSQSALETLRRLALSAVWLHHLVSCKAPLTVDAAGPALAAALERIACQGGAADGPGAALAAIALAGPPPLPRAAPAGSTALLSPGLSDAADAALAFYAALVVDDPERRDPGPSLLLHGGLFSDGAPPHTSLSATIDLTGRARILFFGPYVAIPSGAWEARFVLDVWHAGDDLLLHADVAGAVDGRAHCLAQSTFSIGVAGRHVVPVTFQVEAPAMIVEFRGFTARATFDGRLTLVGVELVSRNDST